MPRPGHDLLVEPYRLDPQEVDLKRHLPDGSNKLRRGPPRLIAGLLPEQAPYGYPIPVEKAHPANESWNAPMTAARTQNLFSYLLVIALLVAFIPSGGIMDAAAGDEPCCPPEDTCCQDSEADDCDSPTDQDCCPSDCSACLLTCCTAPASFLASPVVTEGNGETDGTSPLYCSNISSTDSNGIYHPPRR